MKALRSYKLAVILAALALSAGALWAVPWSPEYEKKVGSEAAVEAEKRYKVLADDAKVKYLNDMAAVLGRASDRPDVVYSLKVLDSEEVNAFSLPGGFIYVTKGLLTDAESDDEVAGVVAHEIAHNCGYDGLQRAQRNEKLFMGSLAAALAAVLLGGHSEEVTAVLQAGEFVRMGVLSHYSIEFEKRADRRAVRYMTDSKAYNPVGLLTFMERLDAKERRSPKGELGIYADHPDTNIRVSLLIDYLEDAEVEINRRAVTKWDPPQVTEREADGRKLATLSLWGVPVFETAHAAGGAGALERVNGLGESLKQALAGGLEPYEVGVVSEGSQARVTLGDRTWLTVYAEDVVSPDTSPGEAAKRVGANLGAAFYKERLGRWF